jgi:hypothetical protein
LDESQRLRALANPVVLRDPCLAETLHRKQRINQAIRAQHAVEGGTSSYGLSGRRWTELGLHRLTDALEVSVS